MSNTRNRAEELSNRPYTETVFRDRTTDDDYIYVALTPELEGCVVQGESVQEALDNLKLFRVDYIQHLLDNKIPVPNPAWTATRTEGNTPALHQENAESSLEDAVTRIVQPTYRENVFESQLKVENDRLHYA